MEVKYIDMCVHAVIDISELINHEHEKASREKERKNEK